MSSASLSPSSVGVAYLSWDSNDHPMDCQKSWFLKVLERERDKAKTKSASELVWVRSWYSDWVIEWVRLQHRSSSSRHQHPIKGIIRVDYPSWVSRSSFDAGRTSATYKCVREREWAYDTYVISIPIIIIRVAVASEELTRNGSADHHSMECPAATGIYKCDRESELMIRHQDQSSSSMRVAYPSWVGSWSSDGLPRVVIFNLHEVTLFYVQDVLYHMYSTYIGTCTKRPTSSCMVRRQSIKEVRLSIWPLCPRRWTILMQTSI